MKKKILALLLACILSLGLVACSDSQPAYVPPASDASDDADTDNNKKTDSSDKQSSDKGLSEEKNEVKIEENANKSTNFNSKGGNPGDILNLDGINYQKIDDEVKANKVDCDIDLSVPSSDITLTGYTLAQETSGDDIKYYAYLFLDYSNNLGDERCFYNGYIYFYQNGVSLSNYQFEGDGFTMIKKGAEVSLIIRAELRDTTTDIDIEVKHYSANYQGEELAEATLKIK